MPIIAFGQQPSGFFPKRFLVAKILTARKLQKEIGGDILFFYHDADHDPRELRTILHHRQTGKPQALTFEFENKLQRKFSPLYAKRIPAAWHKHTANALGNYVDKPLVHVFRDTPPSNTADFCLEIMRHMHLLDGITVLRSGDPAFRERACDITGGGDFFVDIEYENELVRARATHPIGDAAVAQGGNPGPWDLSLHEGGPTYLHLPPLQLPPKKSQISPTRDTRLKWMQSVLRCTHYIAGAGEQQYMNTADCPEITYLPRDPIDRSDEAWTEIL
jgi:hypothetical protein